LAEQRAVNSKVPGSSPGTPANRPSVTVAQRSPKPQDGVQFSGSVQKIKDWPISLAVKALPCHGRDRQFKSGMGRYTPLGCRGPLWITLVERLGVCLHSSAGQSNRLLICRSQVRILLGVLKTLESTCVFSRAMIR
jgi:hypothetical protein